MDTLRDILPYDRNRSILEPSQTDNNSETKQIQLLSYRVFLNHVDSYRAFYIASFLTDQIQGASKLETYGGEEGLGEEEPEMVPSFKPSNKYQMIGTVQFKFGNISEDMFQVLKESEKETYEEELLSCAFVVFDITQDSKEIPKALAALNLIDAHIEKVKNIGPKTFMNYNETRVFVLISTVMTWALTKPLDPDDPDIPFNESDYRKRKAHPLYAEHIALEREVILRGRKYKNNLKTYVLCCGIIYGMEEEDLQFQFKMAWYNENRMPIFQSGRNKIPLIHVQDLAKILHGIFENQPRKPQYILAVEQTPCSLKQIIKGLSKSLGRSKVKDVTQEEAFLYNGITQTLFERLTLNLNMEPSYIVEDLELEYKNELNLAENIANIVNEFKKACSLVPIKILLHGPPGSGKTTLAKDLADKYGLHYVSETTAVQETLENLKELIATEKAAIIAREEKERMAEARDTAEDEDLEAVEEEEEDENADLEELEEQLRDLESTIENSESKRLPDEVLIKLVRDLLGTNLCQNQGYILDGFPSTMQQTKELFGASDEGEDEELGEEDAGGSGAGNKIMPAFVISLAATDEFICNRIMELPEEVVQNTELDEEAMLQRLEEYHVNNLEDNTLLNFFNEIEIHPIVIDVMLDNFDPVYETLFKHLGHVVGFPKTPDEIEEMIKCQAEKEKLKEEQEKIENEIMELKLIEEHQAKMEEWTKLLEQYQLEEEKLIVVQCEPLRNYLMKYVFPTLTAGLLAVANTKPHDPIDYLAEFLFKSNEEGRMFDPAYSRDGELLHDITKELQLQKENKL